MFMSEQITDFVATDDSGGFLNLRTGVVFDIEDMLRSFTRAEVLQIPLGHRPVPRQPRPAARR
jgi:hypothetical protein